MFNTIITSFSTPATFGAGRQPLASIHFNTPKSKSKKPVKGQKVDNVLLPPTTATHTKIAAKRVDTCDLSVDDDIPLAILKQLRSASISTYPSILQRGTTIKRKPVELDINSESPLTHLLTASAPPPTPQPLTLHRPPVEPKKLALHVIPVQPRNATVLHPVGPVRAMMCIVQDCPHDWHIHIHPSNL